MSFNKKLSKLTKKENKLKEKEQEIKKLQLELEKKRLELEKQNTELKKSKDVVKNKQMRVVSKEIFGKKNKLNKLLDTLNETKTLFKFELAGLKSQKKRWFRVIINPSKKNLWFRRKHVLKHGNKLSKILDEYGIKGEITTLAKFDGSFKSSEFTKIGEKVKLWQPNVLSPVEEDEEYIKKMKSIDKFKTIVFYIKPKNEKLKFGGDSKNNDCLWWCINKTIPNYNPWKYPEDLKAFLRLKTDKMISIEYIEAIEKKIGKVGINISGDYNYTSKLGLLRNIHLILKDNHYSINHRINNKVSYVSFTPRKLLLVKEDDGKLIGYDGENYININDSILDDIINFRTEYIKIPYEKEPKRDEKRKILKDEKGKTIYYSFEEYYHNYIDMSNKLFDGSNGEIDTRKTGTILRTAQNLLDQTTKYITPENILFDEAKLIQGSTRGSLIFIDKDYKGEGYKYDIISQFPYIMSKKQSLVPTKRGIYKIITKNDFEEMKIKLKGSYAYGIYRIKIYPSQDDKINRLFKFDEENNIYTSIDLKSADLLGLKMEIIEDGELNALLYPRSFCLQGDEVFKTYVDKCYELKKQKIEGAKLLLNIISGSIGELNKTTITCKDGDKIIDLDELNLEPLKVSFNHKTKSTKAICVDKNYFFKSKFARYKPFLWAECRYMMIQHILKTGVDNVVKCITDGIITKVKVDSGDKLGDFKFEGYCSYIEIFNNRKLSGEFEL